MANPNFIRLSDVTFLIAGYALLHLQKLSFADALSGFWLKQYLSAKRNGVLNYDEFEKKSTENQP
ncbi:MAG: hypothetical protein VKJ04_04175 [Vampirovibrionales bacterium]|nr:hypothetical protein [Vampirovibrionales bacterium]